MVLVAHVIDPAGGGMAAMNAAYVAALSERFELTLLANEVDEASAMLAQRVVHVPTVGSPAALRFAIFWVAASLRLRRLRRSGTLVWTTGAICAGRADLISVHLCQAGLVEAYGKRLTAAGLRGPRRLAAALHRALALTAERHAFKRCGALGAVSGSLAAELERLYPQVRVLDTPNGADLASFATLPARREPNPALVVGFIGGDWPLRRLDDLLEGVAQAAARGVDVALLVAGRGDAAWLEARVEELALAGRCTYLGEVEGSAGVLSRCDVVAIPSPYETFSLVALEAAAAGRALVGRAVGVVPELVGEREGGIVVGGEPSSFAEAFAVLAADPVLLRSMGGEAQRRSGRFTLPSATMAMGEVLEGLAR